MEEHSTQEPGTIEAAPSERQGLLARARLTLVCALALALLGAACSSLPSLSFLNPLNDDAASAAAPTADGAEGPTIRVRIAGGVTETVFASQSPLRVTSGPHPPQEVRGPITVRREGDGWSLATRSGQPIRIPDKPRPLSGSDEPDSVLRISTAEPEALLTADGLPLAGTLWLHPREGAESVEFDTVEHLAMERYLPGVVEKELPNFWQPATYRAQAIAARSYAVHERQRARAAGRHYDVEASTRDQAYAGGKPSDRSVTAVQETRGQVLTWYGTVLRAYYSSTSGGRQARARDIWPTTGAWALHMAEPLNAAAETPESSLSPMHRWEVVRDRLSLARRLAAYGEAKGMAIRKLDDIASIKPEGTSPNGRPTSFRIANPKGLHWTMNAEHFRQACNWDEPAPVPEGQRVASADLEAKVVGTRIIISGRGFGHGVGMCQWGAEALARQGRSTESILQHYYPGAGLDRIY